MKKWINVRIVEVRIKMQLLIVVIHQKKKTIRLVDVKKTIMLVMININNCKY